MGPSGTSGAPRRTWPGMGFASYGGNGTRGIAVLTLAVSLGCTSPDAPVMATEMGTTDATASPETGGTGAGTSGGSSTTTEAATTGDVGETETRASSSGLGGETSDSAESTEGGETSAGGCIGDVTAGAHSFACDHLTVEISVPEECLIESCGLILDVHGRTMSAQMEEANTELMALGMQRGYVVIQPSANRAPPLSSWNGATDDATVVDVVEQAIDVFGVDPDRVHVTGFSQGGSMTWRLLADYGELWASAAPAAACGIGLPSTPVPLLYMHGTEDALTAYDCAEPYVDALRDHYGLAGEGEVVDMGPEHTRVRYGEESPALVELLAHDYDNGNPILGGHCYPGSQDPGGAPGQLFSFACGGDEAFAWGETVIDFFEMHPRAPR